MARKGVRKEDLLRLELETHPRFRIALEHWHAHPDAHDDDDYIITLFHIMFCNGIIAQYENERVMQQILDLGYRLGDL